MCPQCLLWAAWAPRGLHGGCLHGRSSARRIFFDCNRPRNLAVLLRTRAFKQGSCYVLTLFSSHKNIVGFFLGCKIFDKTFEIYIIIQPSIGTDDRIKIVILIFIEMFLLDIFFYRLWSD